MTRPGLEPGPFDPDHKATASPPRVSHISGFLFYSEYNLETRRFTLAPKYDALDH